MFDSTQAGATGECTNAAGITSNWEIRQLIEDENITPILNVTAMVKYLTYGGDTWIGYDDDKTYATKEAFANDRCLGVMMICKLSTTDSIREIG
jgi:chitinase